MIPAKPFDSYKWRWLSTTPTEGLLVPPVFLGVLRALSRHEGSAPSDPVLIQALSVVRAETNSSVDLARTGDRNLVRNSGQYWKGTGLLEPVDGEIQLTPLGRRIAVGALTQGEFAAIMVKQTILPNPWTTPPDEIKKWRDAGLEIRPLKLILELLDELGNRFGLLSAYITTNELIRIIIPLVGAKTGTVDVVDNLVLYRKGELDISAWPDCASGANDDRMARELLLFLANFGILRHHVTGTRNEQRFYLDELFDARAIDEPVGESIFSTDEASAARAVDEVEHSALPSIVERLRARASVLVRKGQSQFRARTISAYERRCFLTGESILGILEAAHIVPVQHGGSDEVNNSLCLRVDVYRLFDSGKIRLRLDGSVALTDAVANSNNYSRLPRTVVFPRFVNPANLRWRDEYL